MIRTRRRGEGITEYAAITMLIMVCSVVGLLRAGSHAIDSVATSKALCADCPDAKLTGDDISALRDAMRAPPASRTLDDERLIRDLGKKQKDYLEELKKAPGYT